MTTSPRGLIVVVAIVGKFHIPYSTMRESENARNAQLLVNSQTADFRLFNPRRC
jgi:hypothetical protein